MDDLLFFLFLKANLFFSLGILEISHRFKFRMFISEIIRYNVESVTTLMKSLPNNPYVHSKHVDFLDILT